MLTHRNIIFQIGAFKRIGLPLERDRRGAELPAAVPRRRAASAAATTTSLAMHVVNFAESARHGAAEPARGGAAHASSPCRACGRSSIPASPSRCKEGTALGRARLPGRNRASACKAERLRAGGQARAGAPARGARDRPTGWCSRTSARMLGLDRIRWRRHRRGADLAGSDPLVLGARHRACTRSTARPRTAGLATANCRRPHQARHHRQRRARHRGQALAAGRDPAARAAHLHGLPQQAGEDRRDPDATAGCTPATSASSTTRASCASPTA